LSIVAASLILATGLATGLASAQDEGGGDRKPILPTEEPTYGKPTAAQLANPDYHPPAKRVMPSVGILATIKPTGTTPRLPDGHPDLSGMWTGRFPLPPGRNYRRSNGAGEADQGSMQRAAWWNKPIYKPELWNKVVASDFGKESDDPGYSCGPIGIPRGAQHPIIMMNSQQAWLRNGEILRVVPLDNRPRNPDDEDQSYNSGVPIGHWDGDTLVIDSVGFDDKTWIAWVGYFHSDRMSVEERFTREGNVLYYQYTWTDPVVLQKPYTSVKYAFRLNPNLKAIPNPLGSCGVLPTDSAILDKYFRG
jgi:hypothetical protein